MMSRIFYILFAVIFLASCNNEDGKKFLRDIKIGGISNRIFVGDVDTLRVVFDPANANDGFPEDSVIWSSSDTTILSVSPEGVVRGLAAGKAFLRVDWGLMFYKMQITVDQDSRAITDTNFLAFCIENFDLDGDGILMESEVAYVESIDFTDYNVLDQPVSFKGIEMFRALRHLTITNKTISYLDVSNNTMLNTIDIALCEIDTIDIRELTELRELDCHSCPSLKAILIGSSTDYQQNYLDRLYCWDCSLTELDFSRCGRLAYLDCHNNQLSVLDLSNCPYMKQITCYGNSITSLILSPDLDMDNLVRFETDSIN